MQTSPALSPRETQDSALRSCPLIFPVTLEHLEGLGRHADPRPSKRGLLPRKAGSSTSRIAENENGIVNFVNDIIRIWVMVPNTRSGWALGFRE
ncbi:MAG TPA: hypothetical protein P5568_10060, partial [Acidobacteriota bacterium]|nr:hypothetical protein [Acidobacteriota bacterium]